MEPSQAMAERLVGALSREDTRAALMDAPPMRPGRGRKASSPSGRRLASWRTQREVEHRILSLPDGLRSGSFSLEDARQEIREAGLEAFVRLAQTRDEAACAFADFYRQGLHFLDVSEAEGLLRVRFCTRKPLP